MVCGDRGVAGVAEVGDGLDYQERLLDWRSTALPVNGADGDYGTETETWVESFQVTEELESTGNIDGLTAARLDSYALDLVDAKLRRDLIAVQQESRNADAALEAGKADTDHTHGFTGTTEPAGS